MTMLKAEEYMVDTRQLQGWRVSITSYKIGDQYYCHIDNVDPGATIARANGKTRGEAVQSAIAKADQRLPRKEE